MTLVDTEAAAFAAGVAPATIRDWCRAHQLTRHGTRRKAMWDLAEVYRLATQRHARDTPDDETGPTTECVPH